MSTFDELTNDGPSFENIERLVKRALRRYGYAPPLAGSREKHRRHANAASQTPSAVCLASP